MSCSVRYYVTKNAGCNEFDIINTVIPSNDPSGITLAGTTQCIAYTVSSKKEILEDFDYSSGYHNAVYDTTYLNDRDEESFLHIFCVSYHIFENDEKRNIIIPKNPYSCETHNKTKQKMNNSQNSEECNVQCASKLSCNSIPISCNKGEGDGNPDIGRWQ